MIALEQSAADGLDPLAAAGKRERDRLAQKARDQLSAIASIDDLMKAHLGREDKARKEKARNSLQYYLEAYYPNTTGLSPLSNDHKAIIARIEVLIRKSGRGLNIMPRGFIKSTLSENSLTWAMLFGYRKYCMFYGGTGDLAEKGIKSIYEELVTNELLLQDFPEACVPFIALQGRSQRCASQHYAGKLTKIHFTNDALKFANVGEYPCCGAIIEAHGLLAPPRGARFKDAKGRNMRPDMHVLDDPQTDDSARSIPQTRERMKVVKKSIGMMGAHGKKASMIMNATIIEDNDLADRLSRDHSWMTIRVSMLKTMPLAMDTLWLGPYADIRRNYDKSDPEGQLKAWQASTEFYRQHQAEMDAGAEPAWSNIGLEEHEISAIQHAINIYIDEGPETFWAECQNRPLRATTVQALEITEDVGHSYSGLPHREVPIDTAHLVFGIDVHDELHYYTVAAIQNDFTGYIIDYGTWPEQATTYFTKASAKQTLQSYYRSLGETTEDNERLIELGVEDLLIKLLKGDWRNSNGEPVSISCGLVDVGYKPTHVKNAIRRLLPDSRVVVCSHGIGIGPTKKPMTEYDTSPQKVIRSGPDPLRPRWIFPQAHRDGEIYRVNHDTNFWKDTTAYRFLQTSPAGRWTFWGNRRTTDHGHYVTHLMSESVDTLSSDGRTVNVWGQTLRGDNHWWDTAVMCVIAGSLCGAVLPVEKPTEILLPSMPPAHQPQPQSQQFGEDILINRDDGRSFFATAR